MNTLLRNTPIGFSQSRSSGHGLYEALDQTHGSMGETDIHPKIITHLHQDNNANVSAGYKRQRAKKRLIFLQGYKLGADSGKLLNSRKLYKVAVKVRSVAVSFVSFMGFGFLRSSSCKSGFAITNAISPTRVPGFCSSFFKNCFGVKL